MTAPKEFYRYEIDNTMSCVRIKLVMLELVNVTPAGYWIKRPNSSLDDKRWISKTSKKRFAYPTKKEAKISFMKRTQRRYDILNFQMSVCRTALENIDDLINNQEKSVFDNISASSFSLLHNNYYDY